MGRTGGRLFSGTGKPAGGRAFILSSEAVTGTEAYICSLFPAAAAAVVTVTAAVGIGAAAILIVIRKQKKGKRE